MSGREFPVVNAWPFALLTFCCAVGPLPFGLVGFALASAGRSTVVWAGLGILAGVCLAWVMVRCTAPTLGGGLGASVWALAGAAFFLVGAGISMHLWLDVLRVSEFPLTPSWAIAACTLSAAAYAARTGVENLLRIALPLAFVLTIGLMAILALSWGLGDTARLAGGWHLLTPAGALPAAWPLLLFASHGTVLVPVLGRRARGSMQSPVLVAAALAGLALAAAFVLPIVVWNLTPALTTEFPLLHAITPVSTIFFPVHRLALLVFVPVQMNLMVQVAAFVLGAMQLLRVRIAPLASGPGVLLGCAAVAVMAVWPAPAFAVARVAAGWSLAGLVLFLALPAFQGRAALRDRLPW